MEIVELLKKSEIYEWLDEPKIRLVPAETPYGTSTVVAFSFKDAADAVRLVELVKQIS